MPRLSAIVIIALCVNSVWATGRKHNQTEWQGTVTHVSDGDTLWVRPGGTGEAVKIRMDGIDAPETCQTYGGVAQRALAARVLHQTVNVQARSRDGYGRLLGRIQLQSEDVGEWMVSQGHAWAHRYKRYKSDYGAQETEARAARRGLFADPAALDPGVFRKQHGSCHK